MANLQDINGSQTLREAWPKIEANEQALNAEIAANKAASDARDNDLQLQLDAEKSARITADSAETQARINADSAHLSSMTAHDASAITFAPGTSGIVATKADAAIKEVNTRVNNIIAGPASSAAEVIDARTGADTVARPTLGNLIREVHAALLDAAVQKTPIKRGIQNITASQAGRLIPTVYGGTLVNLLWRYGNFESDSGNGVAVGWTKSTHGVCSLTTANVKYGAKAQVIQAQPGDAIPDRSVVRTMPMALKAGRYYVFLVDVILGGTGKGFTQLYSDTPSINVTNTVNESRTSHLKVSPTADSGITVYLKNIEPIGGTGTVQYDGARLYEVDSATYAKVGVDPEFTGEKLAAKYPYVDDIKPVFALHFRKFGKNLLPYFNDWRPYSNPNAPIVSLTEIDVTSTNGFDYFVPVIPGTRVSVQVHSNDPKGRISHVFHDANNVQIGAFVITEGSGIIKSENILVPTNAVTWRIALLANVATNVRMSNPMAEVGDKCSAYEPRNDDYLYFPDLRLHSNVDGTVYDQLYVDGNGQYRKLARFREMMLDGSLGWAFDYDGTGFKFLRINLPGAVKDTGIVAKYNGKLLKQVAAGSTEDGADIQILDSGIGRLLITVADSESGWTESLNPNNAAANALMNGWKANGNNGTVYNSWVSVLDGSAPPTNTEAYVSAKKAPNWTGWASLTYHLAQISDEPVTYEGAISLHQGGNVFEMYEGIIVREPVTPYIRPTDGLAIFNSSFAGEASSQFKNRNERILAIYKNGIKETRATIRSTGTNFGIQRAEILKADYDQTAEYTVTYSVLDKYALTANVVNATGEYNTNPKMVIDSLVRRITETETITSVNVNAIAELYKRVKALGE